ncbi:hypothetical protein MJG53_020137 [Ovis ammon polii x Ovis aries]|uniref:Uncharacterized protein n=1 Tax=Ovis ammon polii x Ovis aries TaxID=2918886 RepID=A0ACB9U291_9CETA|nr:hypothetical protein MJG53_020137 [Ovis ammon polii x Ovis aries]
MQRKGNANISRYVNALQFTYFDAQNHSIGFFVAPELIYCNVLVCIYRNVDIGRTETSPVASGSTWPGMWNDWILYLQRIVNNHQLYVMISEQDEVLLSYMIDLKVSEGE